MQRNDTGGTGRPATSSASMRVVDDAGPNPCNIPIINICYGHKPMFRKQVSIFGFRQAVAGFCKHREQPRSDGRTVCINHSNAGNIHSSDIAIPKMTDTGVHSAKCRAISSSRSAKRGQSVRMAVSSSRLGTSLKGTHRISMLSSSLARGCTR